MLSSLARLVTHRSRTVLALCLVAVVLAAVAAVGVFARLGTAGYDDPSSDSAQAQALLNQHFGGQPDLVFLVRADTGTVDDRAAKASGVALTQKLAKEKSLSGISSYFTAPPGTADPMKSQDGSEALILAHVSGSLTGIDERTGEILDRYNDSSDGVTSVLIGGPRGTDLGRQTTKDVALAESIAVPVTLVLLLLVFGSLVAALLPLAVAAFAMTATAATLFVLTQFTDVSVFAINLITALGLGLGVDYALLLVSRYREELAGGATRAEAIDTTLNTAGRTILFSGVTVIAALAALLAFPPYFLKSFAYAGIGVVVFSVIAALVLLPALLALLGDRVNAGALPGRRRRAPRPDTFWAGLVSRVMARPVLIGLPVLVILVAVATPLLHLSVGNPDDRVLPASAPAHRVGDALRHDFATDPSSALDIVVTDSTDSAGLGAYASRLSALPGVATVTTSTATFTAGEPTGRAERPDLAADGLQRINADLTVDPASAEAKSIVNAARALPQAPDALISGPTAQLIDNTHAVTDHFPLAGGIVVATTLLMLFLLTGSVVHPVRAILSNAVTLATTMGIAVWVFQDGHLASVIGFTPDPLSLSILVLTGCVAFGLSMDYEVFLMSRIKEARDHGQSAREAVVTGVSRTGRIITSCAALLAVSFFAFVTGNVSMIQLLGLATGLAILIDATIVRAVLVPAFLSLAGEKAWYAPKFLQRLHRRIGISEGGPAPKATAEPEATRA
jgi:RND superfamily putative drug exporter